jgi:nitrile hydratase
MGGLLGAGPLELNRDHPTQFWERQTDAVCCLLSGKNFMTVDEMRRGIESLQPELYDELSYYERWAVSAANVMLERGVLDASDLDKYLGSHEESPATEKLNVGDHVRVMPDYHASALQKPHLRTPGYIFGKMGIIERDCGEFSNPELLAYRRKGPAQALYRVRFLQSDVWPEYAELNTKDTVDVEIYDHWLTRAGASEGVCADEAYYSLSNPEADCNQGHSHDHGHSHSHRHSGEQDTTYAHRVASGQTAKPTDPWGTNDDSHGHSHGHNHGHDHGDGHDHVHEAREVVERNAVDAEGAETRGQLVASALKDAALDRGLFTKEELRVAVQQNEMMGQQQQGARIVARAWVDDGFRKRLLQDANGACAELGITASNNTASTVLTVVENTEEVHNLVVCTLCSCYPRSILGMSPSWYGCACTLRGCAAHCHQFTAALHAHTLYIFVRISLCNAQKPPLHCRYKSRSYRSRAVREPRRVLDEFGTGILDSQRVQVSISSATRQTPGKASWLIYLDLAHVPYPHSHPTPTRAHAAPAFVLPLFFRFSLYADTCHTTSAASLCCPTCCLT